MARTLIFDLDGTLVDSVPDLTSALNRLMAARALGVFDPAQVTTMVGDGAKVLVDRAFAARGSQPDAAALGDFLADYGANAAVETRAFPGVTESLARLADLDWRMAVCTNKPEMAARSLLAALRLDKFFSAIGGGDSYPVRKPDPGHLLATIQAAGGRRDSAVMVGDHANDIAAASGAGIPCIFAGWGYGPLAMADGAAAIAQTFTQAATLAAELIPAD